MERKGKTQIVCFVREKCVRDPTEHEIELWWRLVPPTHTDKYNATASASAARFSHIYTHTHIWKYIYKYIHVHIYIYLSIYPS